MKLLSLYSIKNTYLGDNGVLKKFHSHKLSKFNLSNESNQFPFTVYPLSDELFPSWIARLAKANFSSFTYFLNNLNLTEKNFLLNNEKHPIFSNLDINSHCPQQLLQILSKNAGISRSEIENLTIKTWDERIPPKLKINFKSRVLGSIRYCHLCLKEEIPYIRKEWAVSFNTISQTH